MGRRSGEGGRRDIVEGSGNEGIFVEEAGGGMWVEKCIWSWGERGVGLFQAYEDARLSVYPDERGLFPIVKCYLLYSLNL